MKTIVKLPNGKELEFPGLLEAFEHTTGHGIWQFEVIFGNEIHDGRTLFEGMRRLFEPVEGWH